MSIKAIATDAVKVDNSVEIEVKFVVDTVGIPREISVAVTLKVILPVTIVRYRDDALVAMR